LNKEFNLFLDNLVSYSILGLGGGILLSIALRKKLVRNCALGVGIGGGIAY
jgi:hypothetical protein